MTDILPTIISIFMALGTIFVFINLFLIFWQYKHNAQVYAVKRVGRIAKIVLQFYKHSSDMKPYTEETKPWYIEFVEPYLDFLMITALEVEKGLIKPKVIKTYVPTLTENYQRIKDYIELGRKEWGSDSWSEIAKLNKKLGIEN